MIPADRIALLGMMGVRVALTADGRLDVTGPAPIVAAAVPKLRLHREELIQYLRRERKGAT